MKKLIFSIVALCAGMFATAQTSFYVYKTDGSAVEYAVSEVDSISFTKPEGSSDVLAGAFSVAEGKQIAFSRGNLQYTQSTATWAFAEHQYDMIGTANVSGSDLADKIDLFGWSADNETAKWGISTSTLSSSYSGDFVDWGKNIGDGTTYRTLTKDEWYYLLKTRTNASEKTGVACIKLSETEYANGLILLPDDWTAPADVAFKSGFSSEYSIQAYADYQTFTLDQWQKLEAAGAVFLPASGYRDGSDMYDVQDGGYYWSATPNDSSSAYVLYFYSDEAYTSNDGDRDYGQAVRLVKDISSPVTALQPAESITLYTENGRIICAQEFQIFTITGQNVTEMNGSLCGVYIVKVGNKAQKIVVK